MNVNVFENCSNKTLETLKTNSSNDKCNINIQEFKKYYNIEEAILILKDWITKKNKLPIPNEFLKDLLKNIQDENCITFNEKMINDLILQEKFLNEIIEELINTHRLNYVSENFKILKLKDQCFRKMASYFNSPNLTIYTKVTKENRPSKKILSKLFRCKQEITECITNDEIEATRIVILIEQQNKLRHHCDCCILNYIKKDLKYHKNKDFPEKFSIFHNIFEMLDVSMFPHRNPAENDHKKFFKNILNQ